MQVVSLSEVAVLLQSGTSPAVTMCGFLRDEHNIPNVSMIELSPGCCCFRS